MRKSLEKNIVLETTTPHSINLGGLVETLSRNLFLLEKTIKEVNGLKIDSKDLTPS